MRFKPQEGLEVIATGKLTTYPGSSKYQIVIEAIEPAGVGALMALMEERKRKLAAEGLFDEARKQLLPWLPEVIGVVTSPTGAVIRDILHRLEDRFPRRVLVWPVKVQGEGSAEQIAAAIRGFDALPEGGPMPRPGPADRRARRRLARGPVVVQRGGRGPRGRRQHDPADLRGRPRDRYHADRFRRRQARADADGRGRNGRAGAQRTGHRGFDPGARTMIAGSARRKTGATSCARAARALPRPRTAGDPAAAARRRCRALPRALKANTHAHFRRFAGQRASHDAGAARAGRAGKAAADRVRRAMTHCAVAVAPPPGSLRRPRDPPEGLKAVERAGAAQIIARDANASPPRRARRERLRPFMQVSGADWAQRSVAHRPVLPQRADLRLRWCATTGPPVHAAAAIGPAAHLTLNLPMVVSAPPRIPTGRRLPHPQSRPQSNHSRLEKRKSRRQPNASPNRSIKAACFKSALVN